MNMTPSELSSSSSSSSLRIQKLHTRLKQSISAELWKQKGISVPLTVMNLIWFTKITITTAFMGRIGELQLAGGALGFTFANATGFAVLNGLCGAMEPICGQAFGAKNYRLLHKTLFMTTLLLLLTAIPISLLWLKVDTILIHLGQQEDISLVAKNYLMFLLPDLVVTSFLCPIKAYLSSQGITLPIMFSSALALACHLPLNFVLSKSKGIQGVSMAIWLTDLILVILLVLYMLVEGRKKGEIWKGGGWWEQKLSDWIRLLKLSGSCCLTTCLEWWCYEILIFLTGRLPNARQALSVLTVVLNFDYLLYSVMLSLAICASTRVSNELGANQPQYAKKSAFVSLGLSVICGCIGGCVMVSVRNVWGSLFSHNEEVLSGVKKMMLIMAIIEVFNFPLAVCGGIVRGTARPWLAMYANLSGFYMLALPLGVVFSFKVGLKLSGLLLGFLIGVITSLVLLLVFVMRINWIEEADKAQQLACVEEHETGRGSSTFVTEV